MFSAAQLYAEASGPQQQKALRMLLEHADWLQWGECEQVLDIGSGPGNITEHLLLPFLPPTTKFVVGVDKSEPMVQYARKACTDPRLRFFRMDITEKERSSLLEDLPAQISRQGFDKVFCFYLLHWMADMFSQALENIECLMKPGGQGLSIQYTKIPVFDTYVDIGLSQKWAPHLSGVTLEYNPLRTCEDPAGFMEKQLLAAGLQAEHIRSWSGYNVYRSREELSGILTSIDPFLHFLPENLREEYQKDYLDTLLKKVFLSEEGDICIPFTIMTCAFSKPL